MENKEKIRIGRPQNWHRPYKYNGYEIAEIKIYNKNGVVFSINQGWFEDNQNDRTHDIPEIEISEPKLRRKQNFNRDEVFIIPKKRDRIEIKFDNKKAILYIPESEAEVRYMGEEQKQIAVSESHLYRLYGININDKFFFLEKILDRIEKTDFGQEVEKMKDKLEEKDIKISKYDMEKLMKHFEIKEKGAKK